MPSSKKHEKNSSTTSEDIFSSYTNNPSIKGISSQRPEKCSTSSPDFGSSSTSSSTNPSMKAIPSKKQEKYGSTSSPDIFSSYTNPSVKAIPSKKHEKYATSSPDIFSSYTIPSVKAIPSKKHEKYATSSPDIFSSYTIPSVKAIPSKKHEKYATSSPDIFSSFTNLSMNELPSQQREKWPSRSITSKDIFLSPVTKPLINAVSSRNPKTYATTTSSDIFSSYTNNVSIKGLPSQRPQKCSTSSPDLFSSFTDPSVIAMSSRNPKNYANTTSSDIFSSFINPSMNSAIPMPSQSQQREKCPSSSITSEDIFATVTIDSSSLNPSVSDPTDSNNNDIKSPQQKSQKSTQNISRNNGNDHHPSLLPVPWEVNRIEVRGPDGHCNGNKGIRAKRTIYRIQPSPSPNKIYSKALSFHKMKVDFLVKILATAKLKQELKATETSVSFDSEIESSTVDMDMTFPPN